MDSGQHCGSVQDLINLTQNLDCYDLHPGVDNEEMLGRLYVEDMESLEVPDNIKMCIRDSPSSVYAAK